MEKERPPAPQTRLDDLLKRQAESLTQTTETWKSFRADVRSETRKIDELKAMNRTASGARSPNRSFLTKSSPYHSPLRERLGLPTGHVSSASLVSERRYQSPSTRARDKFEAFYESLKMQSPPVPEKRTFQPVERTRVPRPLPPRSPSSYESRLQSLIATSPKRTASPPPADVRRFASPVDDLSSILPLDALLQAKELLRRVGMKGVPPTYLSELRALAELVLRVEDSEDN